MVHEARDAPRHVRLARRLRDLPGRLHRDERGVISLLTVFVALMFTIILGMIVNVARHVDDRARMQNAADAAAYSGGCVMARGLNTLAFSNHLLSETFALTAYLRVAEREDFTILTEPILAEWQSMAGAMENAAVASGVAKFSELAQAIRAKLPYERDLVATYASISRSHAQTFRSAFESILGDRTELYDLPIPQFQRALVRTTPALAQLAANEIAGRYDGRDDRWRIQHGGQPLAAVMWRAHTTFPFTLAGHSEEDPLTRTVPAVDPSLFGPDRPDESNPDVSDYYVRTARSQRAGLARGYLEDWTRYWMGPYFGFANFDGFEDADYEFGRGTNLPGRETGKMSDYIDLMRAATSAELTVLLDDEFRYTNLPHVYRRDWNNLPTNELLDRDHTYVGVAYWNHIEDQSRVVFRNPMDEDGIDTLAFAQSTVFVPRGRWFRGRNGLWQYQAGRNPDGTPRMVNWREGWPNGVGPPFRGGLPLQQLITVSPDDPDPDQPRRDDRLLTQNWMVRLEPATSRTLPAVISAQPPLEVVPRFRPLPLRNFSSEDLDRISFH